MAYQVVVIDDVSNGLLVYVAQAFLLVGSIFGLDYYVKLITRKLRREGEKEGNVPQSNVLWYRPSDTPILIIDVILQGICHQVFSAYKAKDSDFVILVEDT